MRRLLVLLVVALAATASAQPRNTLGVRLSGGVGSFGELTWVAPGVDLVGTHEFCRRWSISAAVGYAPIDNHTFLADGRIVRAAITGRVTERRIHGALVVDLEHVAYYADPDVLDKHPGIALTERRGGFTPTVGLDGGYRVTPAIVLGVFARAAVRELSLFEDPSGRGGEARFVFAGIFLDTRLR